MAVLESCPKHNMVAYLEKTEGNAEFHKVIDFLARSFIHHALTVSPVVSTTFVEQFWISAKFKIINNVRYITAKVAGKPVSISEASIRSDLLFDDVDGIDSLPNQAIFDAIQLMGYEGDLTVLTFNKALFSPQWRPSPTPHILDSIPEVSGRNHGGQSSSNKSLSGNEGGMTLQSVYDLYQEAQEASTCYYTPQSLDEECIFDVNVGRKEILEVKLDAKGLWVCIEDRNGDECREKRVYLDVVSTEDAVSTDKEKEKDSTVSLDEGTDDQTEARSATSTTPTTTPKMFGDDETIAQVLLNMSQAKAVSREKEKGIDPNDKGEEEKLKRMMSLYDTESEEFMNAGKRSFKQSLGMKRMDRKLQGGMGNRRRKKIMDFFS
ncbi:hypothetical protein Tco_0150613 [Tanacetum coccineum]